MEAEICTPVAAARWRPTRTLLAAGGLVVLAAIWFAVGLTRYTPPVLGWLPLLVSVPVATMTSWRAAAQGRTFWRYMSVCIAAMGLGSASAARDFFSGAQQGAHISKLTATIYLAGLVVMLVGLVRIPGVRRSRIEWARFGLDIATVLVTVVVFSWHVVYPRWESWNGGATTGMWAALIVVCVSGFICVGAFVKVAFTGTGLIDRRALYLLALTGAVGAGGGALAPLVASRPYLNTGNVLLPTTCLCVCLASDRQLRATAAGFLPPRTASRRPSTMPYLAVLFTGGLLMVSAVRHTADIVIVAAGSVSVAVLVAVRQVIALRDNARLLDDLDSHSRSLAYQAAHDALTGLPNRVVLAEMITDAIAEDPAGLKIALIDLDDFKGINDDLGHAVGDALLAAVATRITGAVPPQVRIARLGGDEYALLMRCEHRPVMAAVEAGLRLPLHAAGHELVVEASIGLAAARDGDTADELLRRADVAMYEAKALGKGRLVVHTCELDQRSAEQAQIAADLRLALDSEQLFLLYQPIVSIPDGSLYGVESLVRWKHPTRGLVSPVDFIPAAERTGLIVPLGAWILEEACRQAAQWQRELGAAAPRYVTVNVSARQLRESGFAAEVENVLLRTGLAPRLLAVEVTETAVFDGGTALSELKAIAALGVSIALDDFGTGHSSLSLLRTCPADILKVDKSFIDDITGHGQEAVVAAALIQICDGMGLRAVAEGVETADQAAELHRLGYRYAQGYHYARPLPAADVPGYRAAQVSERGSQKPAPGPPARSARTAPAG